MPPHYDSMGLWVFTRVPTLSDVLRSEEHARRVLREVFILRRVNHPNIMHLRNVFARPSATGGSRMIDGKLQARGLRFRV